MSDETYKVLCTLLASDNEEDGLVARKLFKKAETHELKMRLYHDREVSPQQFARFYDIAEEDDV